MSLATHSGWRIPHIKPPLPVLLMHFDGDLIDATGITTFNEGGLNGAYSYVAGQPGFGQALQHGSGVPAVHGSSSQNLGIEAQPFTLEGRSAFSSVAGLGILLAKNYFSTEPPSGQFNTDFAVYLGFNALRVEWSGGGVGKQEDFAFSVASGEVFAWALTDDLMSLRFYLNGALVSTKASLSLRDPAPYNSNASISVLNALRGFAGPSPDWGGSGYDGYIDELRFFIGHALYTGDSYVPASRPFSYRP